MRYLTPVVTGKLRRVRGIAIDEFAFVKSLTNHTVKVTLPSPCSQHYFRWREGVSEKAYTDLEEFFADVARVYQQELVALAALGAQTRAVTEACGGCHEKYRTKRRKGDM
jgi:5-methyltetrahydropteroyltriglutamate--homocysteine methyltransferase